MSITLCGTNGSAEPKVLECEGFEDNSEKEFEVKNINLYMSCAWERGMGKH